MNWWQTLGTAVVTALVTTLLVEAIARPRLEARKDRVLDAERARRNLIHALGDITETLAWRSIGSTDHDTERLLPLVEEFSKTFTRLSTADPRLTSRERELCWLLRGSMSASTWAGMPTSEFVVYASEAITKTYSALSYPTRRFLQRRRALRDARAYMMQQE